MAGPTGMARKAWRETSRDISVTHLAMTYPAIGSAPEAFKNSGLGQPPKMSVSTPAGSSQTDQIGLPAGAGLPKDRFQMEPRGLDCHFQVIRRGR